MPSPAYTTRCAVGPGLCALLALSIAGCAVARQYDLRNQVLSCEQANRLAYATLEGMGFTVSQFDLATVGQRGTLRARRDRGGDEQDVTVQVRCDGTIAALDADEDSCFSSGTEFKRAYYLAFTGAVRRAAAGEDEAVGLDVRLRPVRGLAAKLDFGIDLAAAGILPVQVIIDNQTARAYAFEPAEFVLVRSDGRRVPPLTLDGVVYEALYTRDSSSAAEVTERVQARALTGTSVSAHQRVEGFLFYPLGSYVEGRARLEEVDSGESEGVVVRFH